MENTVRNHRDGTEHKHAHELPEAFTEEVDKDAQKLRIVDNNSASGAPTRTSTGLDRVEEGSEESFPGSDPPSTSSTEL